MSPVFPGKLSERVKYCKLWTLKSNGAKSSCYSVEFNWLGDYITKSALTPYDHISCQNHTSWFCSRTRLQKLKLWIIAANPFQIWGRYANLWITVIFIRSWYTKQSMDLFRLIFSGTILSDLILYYQSSNKNICQVVHCFLKVISFLCQTLIFVFFFSRGIIWWL